jgi:hypothetical protein
VAALQAVQDDPTRLARKVSIVEHMAGIETPRDLENAAEGETLESGTTPQDVMRGYWMRRSSRMGQIAPE